MPTVVEIDNPELDDAVMERRLAGKSIRNIARELKITQTHVSTILDKHSAAIADKLRIHTFAVEIERLDRLMQPFGS